MSNEIIQNTKSIKDRLVYVKEQLKNNAENILRNTLSGDIGASNQQARENNGEIISRLNEEKGIPYLALTDFSLDIYNAEKPNITKFNYTFPGVLSLGKLRNWRGIPSKVITEEFNSSIPLLIPTEFSHLGFVYNQYNKDTIFELLELAGLKMIASLPDGLTKVTIIDNSGSGQNFPRLITLNKKIVMDILSNEESIDRAMQKFKESMNIVTQSIAKNGFKSIEEFNNNKDEIPQPYNFIFIANFPSAFNKRSSEALISLLESGPAAGFHIFMTFSIPAGTTEKQDIVSGIPLGNFLRNISLFEFSNSRDAHLKNSVMMIASPLKNEIKDFYNNVYSIDFEKFYEEDVKALITDLNKRISNVSIRHVISIMKTLPEIEDFWQKDSSVGICVPFAKSGIEDIYFSLGVNQMGETEPTFHALVGGTTGSGKTVTLNDIILHTTINYSPDSVQFWLLDYKEGTEFAIYRNFPYVKILSVESEIEFGHEVLEKAINTITERGEIFKEYNVSNIVDYNNAVKTLNENTGTNIPIMPRIIIVIDEFQKLFPSSKLSIIQKSNTYIEDIVKRGRSFGINLILSTQTLKDLSIDSSILSNMPLRIALKMDEKDAAKFFSEDNQAPKFLTLPGEGYINSSHGLNGKNVYFQAYLAGNDNLKEIQKIITDKMNEEYTPVEINKFYSDRFVYNGDLQGDIETNKDFDLNNVKDKIYIGEVAGLSSSHASIDFKKQFGDHYLVIGEDTSKAASNIALLIEQLSCSSNNNIIHFGCFFPNYEDYFYNVIQNNKGKNPIKEVTNATLGDNIKNIFEEFKARLEKVTKEGKKSIAGLPQIFLVLFYTANIPMLKASSYDPEAPKNKFLRLVEEGAEYGIHICLYTNSYNAFSNADLISKASSFGKKMIFKDGSGIKTIGDNYSEYEFSKSNNVAIFQNNVGGSQILKIKPYVDKRLGEAL